MTDICGICRKPIRWFLQRLKSELASLHAKPKPIAKKVEPKPIAKKVEILRIEPGLMSGAIIVCKINGHEMSVPMTARDKNPKEAIERWVEFLSSERKKSLEIQRKAKDWEGKKLEVELHG